MHIARRPAYKPLRPVRFRNDWFRLFLAAIAAGALAACGGGGGDDGGGGGGGQTTSFTVGGTITGLTQGIVVLRLNGASDMTVTGNASGSVAFTFSNQLANGANYSVSVGTQPNLLAGAAPFVCGPAVTNSTGTINAANVTNVSIACASYSIGGTLSGLKAGSQLTLTLNGDTRQHSLMANGAFTFPTAQTIGIGIFYGVHIRNQPAGQTCTIEGSIGVVRADIPNASTIAIVCVDNVTDALSGTYQITDVDGESAEVLRLRDFVAFYPDGTFLLGAHESGNPDCGPGGQGGLEYGVYNWDDVTHVFRVVRLLKYPANQLECGLDESTEVKLVKRGDGSLLLVDEVGGVTATLTPVPSTPGELTGAWGDNQWFTAYSADGKFFNADTRAIQPSQAAGAFPGIEDGCYTLTGASRVTGSFTMNVTATCAVSSTQTAVDTTGAAFGMSSFLSQTRSFTVSGDTLDFQLVPTAAGQVRALRMPVAPTAASSFGISGTISGLTGTTGLVLHLNGKTGGGFDVFRPAGSTTFAFAARLQSGDAYAVNVLPHEQPGNPTQFCRPTAGGGGTILASDVTGVEITCTNSTSYTVSGNVAGLAGGAQLTLRVRYYDVVPGVGGAFASVDRAVVANGATDPVAIPANVGYYFGIVQQPVGQTCTVARGTGFSTGANISNVLVNCLNNMTSPLSGTYSGLEADGRDYLNFNADGTMTTALIHRNPDPTNQAPPADCQIGDAAIDARNGNGVEYGVFSWSSATGMLQLAAAAAVDTNGDCGFWDPQQAPVNPWAAATRVGNSLRLEIPPGAPGGLVVTVPAVDSVPGSLVGAWVPEANNGILLVFHADGTFMFADMQNTFLPASGHGQERGCYSVSAPDSTVTFSIAAACRPDGLAAYDLNSLAGVFPNGATTTITAAGPFPFTFVNSDTLDFLGRIFKRTAPN